jgi:lipoprotein-releasing system ATP-binding protein
MKSESPATPKGLGENSPLLDLEGVGKRFDAPGGGEPPWVLRGISLRVAAGESLAVTGPSGSGKSTLLNLIGGLDRPTEGRVLLKGRNLAHLDDAGLAAVRRRDVGFVFQLHHLLPQCTALENVLVPTLAGDGAAPVEEAEVRARRLLERVGLGDRMAHRPGQLSGGERQRVAVVRALINAPSLLLADEPTGSLDRAAADSLATLLVELNREMGVTLIAATHAPDLAVRMGRKVELRNGRFIA